MEFFSLMTVYCILFGAVLFVLLFGESEMFEGTAVETCHWLLSDGLCVGSSWALRRTLGNTAGARVETAVEEWLCNRPNPAMQLVYVALVVGGYWTFCVHAYDLLGLYVSSVHRLLVPVAMLASIASWLATCWSDPGTVTRHNLEAHLLAYPFDHVLYKPKECPTMGFTCPPRSKFCRVTRRRVAKFDHFCGWMNNAIGENNLRYFVTFLALHVALAGYGAWLCFYVVYGELTRRGLWEVSFEGSASSRLRTDGGGGGAAAPVTLAQDWALLSKFCMYHFGQLLMLGVFLVVLFVMLGAFLAYHACMIKDGVTTNETFKWKDHRRRVLRAARMVSSSGQQVAAAAEGPGGAEGDVGDAGDDGDGDGDGGDDDDDRDVGCVGAGLSSEGKDKQKVKKSLVARREQKKRKAVKAAGGGGAGAAGAETSFGFGVGGMFSWVPFARRLGLPGGKQAQETKSGWAWKKKEGARGGGGDKDDDDDENDDDANAGPHPVIDVPPTRNIYDKGLRQNIAEVFFPPSQIAARELAKRAAHVSPANVSRQQKGTKQGKSGRT